MEHPAQYKGQEVVVLGLARSGQAVAKLLNQYGMQVTINDRKTREECPEADELEKEGIRVVCGGHPDFLIHPNLAFIVKNPGIPYTIPPLIKAAELGIEVITEVEVAYHMARSAIIGITGSNGKTTTTTWVGRMMELAGVEAIVAGNIGVPLSEVVAEKAESDWIVCELSSFQLKGTHAFRPKISCVLNISETHLDYHGTMDDYISAKKQLVAQQHKDDIAVLNWDDPVCRAMAEETHARILPFSMDGPLDFGVYVHEGTIVISGRADELGKENEPEHFKGSYRHGLMETDEIVETDQTDEINGTNETDVINETDEINGISEMNVTNLNNETVEIDKINETNVNNEVVEVLPVDKIGLPGKHNVYNALAATAIAIAAGVPPQKIAQGLEQFAGVEHRLERVREWQGIVFYNNSKATNITSTLTAIDSFEAPIILIAGGLDRGADYKELSSGLAPKVKGVISLGETAQNIYEAAKAAGVPQVKCIETVDPQEAINQAVQSAIRLAESGDIILLSPSCASWDMFRNFEERGNMFKHAVHNL